MRLLLLELLACENDCLVTARELIEQMDRRGVGSPASVYRLLDEFHALGLVNRIAGRDGVARYERADPGHAHYHLVDAATGAVRPFTDAAIERAIAGVAERHGFRLNRHDVVLHGVPVHPPARERIDSRPC